MGKIVYNGREYLSAGTASTMQGATSTTDGVSGLVPQPLIADRDKVLKGDGTWGMAGTEVEANPSGTATDTLQKVDIDGVIYDIQGGGGGNTLLIQNAEIYSEDEKQIGVYADGKPIYQKTFIFQSYVTYNGQAWTMTTIPNSGMEKIIRVKAVSETGTNWDILGATRDTGNYVYVYNTRNTTISVKEVTLQYTKTTDAAGSGGYQAWGFSPIIYSTEEREVGVWIDNKPLYQKTYLFNALTNVPSGRWFDTGFTATDISIVGEAYGFYQDATAGVTVPILASCDSGTNQTLYIYLARGASTEMHGFTIQYTKTTDVAGSGSYNTLGVPNVHYSTDEQVIGTWMGETLYQKTYNITLTENVTYLDTSALNIKRLIEIIGQCDSNNGNNALFVPYYEDSTWQMYPQMDYANQQLSIVTTATVLQYYSKLSMTIKYTKTTD